MLLKLMLIPLLLPLSLAIEPFTTIAIGGGLFSLATYIYYNQIKCHIEECCQTPWVHERLQLDFSDLYGQPLAVQFVTGILKRRHLVSKPVALSFHGPTGTGKTFLSTIISKMMFNKGEHSSYFHFFNTKYHFSNIKKDLEYHVMLKNIIKGNLTKCEKSVFVFDEFEDMPPEAVSAIASFLEPRGLIDGVKTGQALFIFISNIGDEAIISNTYELYKSKVHRNDFTMRDFENAIKDFALNTKGPYKDSELVKRGLIDAYVPFLPLEKQHVKACIENNFWIFNNRSATPEEVEEILEDVPFSPERNHLYAETGCRKVLSLVLRNKYMID